MTSFRNMLEKENVITDAIKDFLKTFGESPDKARLAAIYVMYGYHRQYSLSDDCFMFNSDDALLNDLHNAIADKIGAMPMKDLYRKLSLISYADYEELYVQVLNILSDMTSRIASRRQDFYTPKEISTLMAYFANKTGCESVYDPFCGTAAIVGGLHGENKNIHFAGQELAEDIALVARVNLEAVNGVYGNIVCADSAAVWNCEKFDAVMSCPPFDKFKGEVKVNEIRCKDYNEALLARALEINHARLVITVAPMRFCYSGAKGTSTFDMREYLVEQNYLDMVIALPTDIFYGTSVPCVLVVCRTDRFKDASVKFVNAEKYFFEKEKRDKRFDVDRFIAMLESEGSSDFREVERKRLADFDFNLIPYLYVIEKPDILPGQRVVSLASLVSVVKPDEFSESAPELPSSIFSDDFMTVLENKNNVLASGEGKKKIGMKTYSSGGNILAVYNPPFSNFSYSLHTDRVPFSCRSAIQVYRVKDSVVTPEYLVFALLNNTVFRRKGLPFDSCMNLPLVIEASLEDQIRTVQCRINEYYTDKEQEDKVRQERLGRKKVVSDLEHVLAPTQFKIYRIIRGLEKSALGSGLSSSIKALRDNIDYLSRMIQFANADTVYEPRPLVQGDIADFIEQYADSWRNYGSGYFDLQIDNGLHASVFVAFDKIQMTVMLDTILDNAGRHSFHKNNKYTDNNIVCIEVNVVEYKEKNYVLIRVANNGNPFTQGFTVKDYIRRGRYASETGRSGLGGYHVGQIVKNHNGYLNVGSNKIWNVMIDILLPIEGGTNIDMVQYEEECI